MYIVSFAKEALNITIYNLYPGLELISPVYYSNGTTYCVSSSQKTDTGTTIEASFGIDSKQEDFKGALLYKLQRKYATRTDNQPNNIIASAEDVTTSVHLLVVWNIRDYDHGFRVCLIEYADDFTWDEDKLWALYRKYNDQIYVDCNSNIITWVTCDGTAVKTRRNAVYGSEYKLNIIISEGTGLYNIKEPMKINPKRSVLSLSIFVVLIYTASLPIKPSVELNIHNQCLNVDLISPTYVTGIELECHRPPNYKVCAGDTMRSAFIIGRRGPVPRLGNASYVALIYSLRRKRTHEPIEISEGTSNAARILVVWKFSESKELCADVLLVEHDRRLVWNKDDLIDLYRENFDRFRLSSDSVTEIWLLDDNIALMSTFEIMHGSQLLNLTISEVDRDNGTRMPIYINLKK
jgi:hypothetical protein